MIMNMKLNSVPFNLIKNNKKSIEIRLNDEKRQLLKSNDYIEFTNNDTKEIIKVQIEEIYKFNTFKDLFDFFDKTLLGYSDEEIANFEEMYDYYSKEEEIKYGVLGIKINKVG